MGQQEEQGAPEVDWKNERGVQQWRELLSTLVIQSNGYWFNHALNIEPQRKYWGRASSYNDAHLFALPNFQSALIEIMTAPGEEKDFLVKELNEDRKKRRKAIRGSDHSYHIDMRELSGLLSAAIESGCGLALVNAILDTGYSPDTTSDRQQQDTRYKANTPAAAAIQKNRPDILAELIRRGATLDVNDLRQAIDHEASECIDLLLGHGVVNGKVNEKIRSKPSLDAPGAWTAGSRNRFCPILVYAAKKGDLATVEKLALCGADINEASWNGDVVSLFGMKRGFLHGLSITGEQLRTLQSLGVTLSNEGSLRLVRHADSEALKLLAKSQSWPSPEALTADLKNAASWEEASRLIQAGASLEARWRHPHPLTRTYGYTSNPDTLAWLSNAFGPPPVGLLAEIEPKTPIRTHLPQTPQSLIQVLTWQELANKDPSAAANSTQCPHPQMAWRALLAAADHPPQGMHEHDFFATAQDRMRMDEALTRLSHAHPIDLAVCFIKYSQVSTPEVGHRLLCGRWSTHAALEAFEACGGATIAPQKGSWHGVVASHGPINAETKDARPARVLALAALGWKPTHEDIAIASKQSMRELLWSIQAADEVAEVAASPIKKTARKARLK
jgi:hypothetical protein